ncbi:MAG TPA: fibronectin type III domain-containing protein [Verrucomicrobiae bacterium]|nr:fibronectin type III domain-containing protein [Verrucomicrobiae bacterium]
MATGTSVALCWLGPMVHVALAGASLTLAWDRSTDKNVVGYNLYYGVASRTYTNMIACGNTTNATVTQLQEGTRYYFAATTLDSAGLESEFSTEISATPAGGMYDGVNLNDPSQAMADPDGDGRSNLMEYALGTNPFNSADNQDGLQPWMTQASGSPYLAIQYKRRKDVVGLQYIPEVSTNNQSWLSDAGHVQEISVATLDSQFDWVTALDQTPVSATAAQFIRLKVILGTNVTASEALIGSATTLLGNGGNGARNTLFSQRMVTPLAYAGIVSHLGAATLTDSNAAWTVNQFNGTNGSFYAAFTNGWTVDITNTDASTHTLDLGSDVRAVAAPGAPYTIRKHFTIATLFGPTNQVGLAAGQNPSAADNILLTIPESQQTMTIFYFNDGAGTQGWFRADYSSAADQVIYPEQGLVVRRGSTGDLLLTLAGPIKNGPTVAPINTGYNLLGTLQAVTNLTLPQLNLYTGDPNTGVAGGLNPSAADNLLLVQPDSTVATYFYYQDSAGNQGWLDAAYNSAQSVSVPAGSAFYLRRKTPYPAFNWIMLGNGR